MIVLLIIYALAILYLTQAIVYLFQIKEYRMDRTISQVREDGVLVLIKKYLGRRAALTSRNMLIVGVQIAALFFTWFAAQSLLEEVVLLPIIGVISAVLGVIATEPLAKMRRKRLIEDATKKAKQSRAVFIGISGTYGKSTTKEYLYHILSRKFKVAKTDENMNTDVGVAVSILNNLMPDTEFFIAEVGAYKLGEVKAAAAVFNPRFAIMLPFGNQHMDLFGSKDNLVASESEILDFIPDDGKVYANADIPELEYVKNKSRSRVVTYSITNEDADVFADDIETAEKGSSARVHYDDKSFKIETKLLGKHVIQNLLPAAAAAIDLGMKREDVAAAIASLDFIPGKLSVHQKNEAVILNDTGNSNLNGFLAAIDTIKLFKREENYILSKGIIELGNEKLDSYKNIIMQIEAANMRLATTDILFKQFDSKNIVTIARNEEELYNYIVSKLNGKTAVLLEGKFTKKFINKFL